VLRAEFHNAAEREIADAAAYLENERPYEGTLFLDAFERAITRLLEFPHAGRLKRRGVRRWVMRHWRYSILYSVTEYGIFVIALAHQSRRENYWRERVR
jgi:plasmid stabilization system protein ParE